MGDKRGFTIVELMLAMAFISVLLVAIAGAVMQVGAIYNRGLTMKSVNQAGRVVIEDMRKTISETQSLSVVYKPQTSGSDIVGGRLCTGFVSYIWNIGVHVNPDDPSSQINRYEGASHEGKQLRLVKVRHGSENEYCNDLNKRVVFEDSVELLSGGRVSTGDSETVSGNLAVQKFSYEKHADKNGMALFSVAIVISDADKKVIDTSDNSCKPPSDMESNQEFCSVSEFNFTALTGNGGSN